MDSPSIEIQSLSSFSNLKSLLLQHAGLSDNSFQGLTNLERLSLDQCHFEKFKSESFRHLYNLEFLSITAPKCFSNINFAELVKLKSLKLAYAGDYSFLSTLSLNKDLNGLGIWEKDFIKSKIFENLNHPNIATFELDYKSLDKFDGNWLNGLQNIRTLSFYSRKQQTGSMKLDLSSLSRLESIHFVHIKFSSLDLVFAKLMNLKRYRNIYIFNLSNIYLFFSLIF